MFVRNVVYLFVLGLFMFSNSQDNDRDDEQYQLARFLRMLDQPEIMDELEIVESQRIEIDENRSELQLANGDFRKVLERLNPSQLESMPPGKTPAEINQLVSEILLPHQMQRLRQLILQKSLHIGNTCDFGTLQLASKLELTPSQIDLIKKTSESIDVELSQEIERTIDRMRNLRKKGQNEITQLLNEEQRAKYLELFGDDFCFDSDVVSRILRYTRKAKQSPSNNE